MSQIQGALKNIQNCINKKVIIANDQEYFLQTKNHKYVFLKSYVGKRIQRKSKDEPKLISEAKI